MLAKCGVTVARTLYTSFLREYPQLTRSLEIVGEIQNTGKVNEEIDTVEAVFYDKENKIIDTDYAFIFGEVKPGEVRASKIKFGKCGKKIQSFAEYDHFKIQLH